MNLLGSPQVRLVVRALLAGVATFVSTLQASGGTLNTSLVIGALTAAGWAVIEYITPLNALVGVFKNPPSGSA